MICNIFKKHKEKENNILTTTQMLNMLILRWGDIINNGCLFSLLIIDHLLIH